VITVSGLEQNSASVANVLPFLVRSSISKIFRPEADTSVSLALPNVQRPGEQMRQRQRAEFCPFATPAPWDPIWPL